MNPLTILTRRPWMIAVALTAFVVLWLVSGLLRPAGPAASPVTAAPAGQERVRVQTRIQQAEPVARFISVYGRTAPARMVELKAETNGRVAGLGIPRGSKARTGDVLLRLDLRDRQARLGQARASVAEAEADYRGQLELKPQGYVSETQLAATLAKLEGARAELVRAELDLEYMNIRAPFDGVVQDRTVEIGDFVRAGDPVITFVDNTHLIVTGSIAEQDAAHVRVGSGASAALVTGQDVQGHIRYIAPVADEATRTFTVELAVPNPGGTLPAGVTAEIHIPGGDVLAQKLSPSLLTLDADGKLGVRTVDASGHVVFHQVTIARSETNGIWVTGLPERAEVIVVGQGYVSAGQAVQPVPVQDEARVVDQSVSR